MNEEFQVPTSKERKSSGEAEAQRRARAKER